MFIDRNCFYTRKQKIGKIQSSGEHMKIVKLEVCRCTAYKFPHRLNGGNCHGAEPECSDCEFSIKTSDPYNTGDSYYSLTECNHSTGCPWGKNG